MPAPPISSQPSRQKAYGTGEVDYYDALGMESVDPEALDPESAVAEGYDFYMTDRAGVATHPAYSHLAPAMLMESAPLTSATALAPYLYTPYLGIYGARSRYSPEWISSTV